MRRRYAYIPGECVRVYAVKGRGILRALASERYRAKLDPDSNSENGSIRVPRSRAHHQVVYFRDVNIVSLEYPTGLCRISGKDLWRQN